MGSYIYNKVKEALGGSNFVSGKAFKGWSPNEVRAIFIMRDFICVADYIKAPVLVKLDLAEVAKDLDSPFVRGSLNNLLSTRQLSCMEEIYVDEAYKLKTSLIDLPAYVSSIVSGKSRLRYWAYVSGVPADAVYNAYMDALTNAYQDFSFAKSVGCFDYNSTDNDDWYKKYLLRPQFYAVDADNGRLATWFRKVEKSKTNEIELLEAKRKELGLYGVIVSAFDKDVQNFRYIVNLLRISNAGSKVDNLHTDIKPTAAIAKAVSKIKRYNGVSQQLLIQAFQTARYAKPACGDALIGIYRSLKIFYVNTSESSESAHRPQLTEDSQVAFTGFINYEDLVINVVRQFQVNMRYKIVTKVALQRYFNDDELRKAYEVIYNNGTDRGFNPSAWEGVLFSILGISSAEVKQLAEAS